LDDTPSIPLPWIKLDVALWYADTLGFDDELVGIYTNLIIFQWVKGRLPIDNMDQLSRISPAAARRWNELAFMFPDGQRPWLESVRVTQTRLFTARSKGGKARAAQAAIEREIANGERTDGD
jgi:uncharacterized protein YdaU (DUF1376 family)